PVRLFNYQEDVAGQDHEKYLWGNATFAFASNMARSFKQYGWTVNIRGPEAGGKLENLPLHHYDVGRGTQAKIPTEILISETKELDFAEEGFIPLSFYKNSDYACFFSANSAQKPAEYTTKEATANSRINSRLPYIFLVSRLAHYLKVLQRENIGASKSRQELENELNDWLQGLVTKMNNPDPELVANFPLQDGFVRVHDIPENPGYYRVDMAVMPHFQIEGVDVRLSLVSQLPAGKEGSQHAHPKPSGWYGREGEGCVACQAFIKAEQAHGNLNGFGFGFLKIKLTRRLILWRFLPICGSRMIRGAKSGAQ
ncbi:MAG: type VI secretion system contractile sheath large subunit, partial [Alcanivorax nanhaiticus]